MQTSLDKDLMLMWSSCAEGGAELWGRCVQPDQLIDWYVSMGAGFAIAALLAYFLVGAAKKSPPYAMVFRVAAFVGVPILLLMFFALVTRYFSAQIVIPV